MNNENIDNSVDATTTDNQEQEQISQVNETKGEQTDNANASTENKADNSTNMTSTEIKTFTQEQVNELIRNRLDRQASRFYKKYGVSDETEFSNLIGMKQSYDVMKERYESGKTELNEMREKLAYIENNIDPSRYDDIRAYFKGKGIEFNNDALVQELETHPEWLKVIAKDNTPTTTIEVLGGDHEPNGNDTNENAKRHRIFAY